MEPMLGILLLVLVGGIFIYWCALPAKPKVIAPPPDPEAAPEPPPPLSCLALGIIKSFDEEPDAWTVSAPKYIGGLSVWVYTHTATKTTVTHTNSYIYGYLDFKILHEIYAENVIMALHDADAIVSAIKRRKDLLAKREADAKAAEAAPRLEYFKKLGCPEGEAT
jgi:hypothetical protein